jgi:hypothetical protein
MRKGAFMADSYRLKIKIGDHEFEAEGPVDIVREQFESFKELVSTTSPKTQNSPGQPDNSVTIPDVPFDESSLGKIMKQDGRIVSLTIRPRNIDEALLLIILGQRYLRGTEVATGAEVMGGITATGGVAVSRIDRYLEKMGREGDLIVMGERRGKRYRFTNSGLTKAQKLATEVLATVA